jgi:hypothetical protein
MQIVANCLALGGGGTYGIAMKRDESMRLKITDIPNGIIKEYNLQEL